MQETERLSALIGDIYAAALDPTLWLKVLEDTAGFVGGSAAILFWKDLASRRGQEFYQYGHDPAYVRSYRDKYVKFDPATNCQLFARVGDIISMKDFVAYDEDMRQRMRLLTPHFRRAVLIGKMINLQKAEAASFADMLDGISAGVFLVDAVSHIVHANAAGDMMLSGAGVLHTEGGRLVANDPQADQKLAETFATADNGDAAVGIKGVAVPLLARDGECYVARVLPLTSGTRRQAGVNYAAVAALFVHAAALDTPSPPEAIENMCSWPLRGIFSSQPHCC
jgi:hypothetical protein